MTEKVTFGITSFQRPDCLERLVASIYKRYPLARILVADNGNKKAKLPNSVEVLNLEFDCGLSAARNALFDNFRTEYLLILEEDFLFTDETNIEQFVEILDSDQEVGVVGGAIRSIHGRLAAYSLDIEIFRQTMYVREASHRVKLSPSGTPYRLCDLIWNFALFRRAMTKRHRWIDELKVGEHAPYYHQVKLAGEWRVACCPTVALYHVPEPRSGEYLHYRRRAQAMFQGYIERHGLKNYRRVLPYEFVDHVEEKPCIVVLGVGHSGTTVLTRMLTSLGWNAGDADAQFSESKSIRSLNMLVEAKGVLPRPLARQAVQNLPRPWAVKDPRFVQTLNHWLPVFQEMERKPTLVRISRSPERMLESYRRRGAPGDVPFRIRQGLELCRKQYETWPWPKVTVEYERLAAAVQLFDPRRTTGQSSQMSGGSPDATGSYETTFLGAVADSRTGLEADSRMGAELDSRFGLELDSRGLPLLSDSEMDGLARSIGHAGLTPELLQRLLGSEFSLDAEPDGSGARP